MSIFSGLGALGRGLFSDSKGPWGEAPGGTGNGDGPGEPPPGGKGPWGEGSGGPGRRRRSAPPSGANITSLDEWLERSKRRFGGGGGLPGRPNGAMIKWAVLGVVALWLLLTTMHRIAPEERGVVTQFGRYNNRTLESGIGLTLPWPIQSVQKVDVENIREISLGSATEETLFLTGDQNIIDIAYQVRWKIRDPEQYLFELAQPEETIKEVAESAMRQVVANVSLQGAMGSQRGEIESLVAQEMRQTLDSYKAGVDIQGVAIRQADPPAAVNDAFKEVTAAQQEAESYVNQANAYALQLAQKAQGDAGAFDRIYEQYRLSPDVTKRRMYYETMERVLQNVDKTIVEAPGVSSYLPLNELKRSVPRSPAQ